MQLSQKLVRVAPYIKCNTVYVVLAGYINTHVKINIFSTNIFFQDVLYIHLSLDHFHSAKTLVVYMSFYLTEIEMILQYSYCEL